MKVEPRLKATGDPMQRQIQAEMEDPGLIIAKLPKVKVRLHHPDLLPLNLLHLQRKVHPGQSPQSLLHLQKKLHPNPQEEQTHLMDVVNHLKVLHRLKKEVIPGQAVKKVLLNLQVIAVNHPVQKVAKDSLAQPHLRP